jgi:hypothetical protein
MTVDWYLQDSDPFVEIARACGNGPGYRFGMNDVWSLRVVQRMPGTQGTSMTKRLGC